MKTLVLENKLITLNLKYEETVDDKCSNKTDSFQSTKPAEIWTWIGHSEGGKVLLRSRRLNNNSVTSLRRTMEGQIEVLVFCYAKPTKDLSDRKQLSLNDIIAEELMEEVTNASGLSSELCYKLSAGNGSYVCGNRTTVVGSSVQGLGLSILWFLLFLSMACFSPYVK